MLGQLIDGVDVVADNKMHGSSVGKHKGRTRDGSLTSFGAYAGKQTARAPGNSAQDVSFEQSEAGPAQAQWILQDGVELGTDLFRRGTRIPASLTSRERWATKPESSLRTTSGAGCRQRSHCCRQTSENQAPESGVLAGGS